MHSESKDPNAGGASIFRLRNAVHPNQCVTRLGRQEQNKATLARAGGRKSFMMKGRSRAVQGTCPPRSGRRVRVKLFLGREGRTHRRREPHTMAPGMNCGGISISNKLVGRPFNVTGWGGGRYRHSSKSNQAPEKAGPDPQLKQPTRPNRGRQMAIGWMGGQPKPQTPLK